jgi:hypothetical protein
LFQGALQERPPCLHVALYFAVATRAHGHEVTRRVRLFGLVKLSERDDVVDVKFSLALVFVHPAFAAPEAVAVADYAAHAMPVFAIIAFIPFFPIRVVGASSTRCITFVATITTNIFFASVNFIIFAAMVAFQFNTFFSALYTAKLTVFRSVLRDLIGFVTVITF